MAELIEWVRAGDGYLRSAAGQFEVMVVRRARGGWVAAYDLRDGRVRRAEFRTVAEAKGWCERRLRGAGDGQAKAQEPVGAADPVGRPGAGRAAGALSRAWYGKLAVTRGR